MELWLEGAKLCLRAQPRNRWDTYRPLQWQVVAQLQRADRKLTVPTFSRYLSGNGLSYRDDLAEVLSKARSELKAEHEPQPDVGADRSA
jgi:hypothetical protein